MLVRPVPSVLVYLLPALGGTLAPGPAGARSSQHDFPEHGLTLELPELEGSTVITEVPPEVAASNDAKHNFDQRRERQWKGQLGESEVSIGLHIYQELGPSRNEPGDIANWSIDELRDRDGSFIVLAVDYHEGSFGYAPFLSVVQAELRDEESGALDGTQYLASGLLDDAGYSVHVTCRPALEKKHQKSLSRFLQSGIAYEGPERDPEWTLDEIRERWIRDTPEEFHGDFLKALKRPKTVKKALIRTDHYIVFTNSSGGKLFAKKLEENYDEIEKTYPFETVEGSRLMPIFLFRTPDQYYQYYAKIADTSIEAARKSKGHAWRDYYATWYEAPGDPVHIHECTHQIFRNRLYLSGGGSWFQEGVAEYIETVDHERNNIAREVKKGRHLPLAEFVALKSLLYSSEDGVRGGGGAGQAYKQAALLIEFLRESKFGKKHFDDFLHAMGRVPRNDVAQIEAVFQKVYGADLVEVDAAWQQYCKKR